MTQNPLMAGLPAPHPGEILKEIVLPGYRKSRVQVAAALGIGRRSLYEILDGERAITADTALRLAKLFGNTAEHWLALQAAHDLEKARARLGDALEAIQTWPGEPAAS